MYFKIGEFKMENRLKRQSLIKNFIKKKEKEYGIKAPEEIVKFGIFTSGLSDSISVNPGNVVNIFERAFLEAKRKEKEELDKISILSCYDTYLKLYEKLTLNEKKKTAYHEAGHYIASIKSAHMKDVKIAFVSILPMMNFMGVNWFYEQEGEDTIQSKEYFMDDLVADLAGRIGEMRVTKKFAAGASSDLKHANAIAKAMILQMGFSEKDNNKNRYYDYSDLVLLSEEKKEQIDKEVQDLINEAFRRGEKILSENSELLDIIAARLLKEEILTGEQLERICKEYYEKKDSPDKEETTEEPEKEAAEEKKEETAEETAKEVAKNTPENGKKRNKK